MHIQSEEFFELEKKSKRRVSPGHRRKGVSPLLVLPIMALVRLPFVATLAIKEAKSLTLEYPVIKLPHLPSAFDGITIAFLTDLHCSRLTPPQFLQTVVAETNRLKPDLVVLGGDYITHGTQYLRQVSGLLAQLKAPLGVFSVLGNHDYWVDAASVRAALAAAGIVDITNTGRWLSLNGNRIRLAGVGDFWEDYQDLHAALDGTREQDVAILLSHNPDYAARVTDARIKLILSGHTHGGQIRLPKVGALVSNSKYGNRLASGLIPFDSFQLYVSRGIGTVLIPMRYNCPPEVSLITLKQ
jgi:predicted MPP superfamily phosphohydrolase